MPREHSFRISIRQFPKRNAKCSMPVECVYRANGICDVPRINKGNSDSACHKMNNKEVLPFLAAERKGLTVQEVPAAKGELIMKIKNVEEYSLDNEMPYLVPAFISGFLFICFGYIAGGFLSLIPEWIGMSSLFIGVISMFYFVDLDAKQEQQRKELARNEYRQLPLDLLKKATTSGELSELTKETITSLLNEEYEGWSFQIVWICLDVRSQGSRS